MVHLETHQIVHQQKIAQLHHKSLATIMPQANTHFLTTKNTN